MLASSALRRLASLICIGVLFCGGATSVRADGGGDPPPTGEQDAASNPSAAPRSYEEAADFFGAFLASGDLFGSILAIGQDRAIEYSFSTMNSSIAPSVSERATAPVKGASAASSDSTAWSLPREMKGDLQIIRERRERIQTNARRARTDRAFRGELERLAGVGNIEAQETLEKMQTDQAVERALYDPAARAAIEQVGSPELKEALKEAEAQVRSSLLNMITAHPF